MFFKNLRKVFKKVFKAIPFELKGHNHFFWIIFKQRFEDAIKINVAFSRRQVFIALWKMIVVQMNILEATAFSFRKF